MVYEVFYTVAVEGKLLSSRAQKAISFATVQEKITLESENKVKYAAVQVDKVYEMKKAFRMNLNIRVVEKLRATFKTQVIGGLFKAMGAGR